MLNEYDLKKTHSKEKVMNIHSSRDDDFKAIKQSRTGGHDRETVTLVLTVCCYFILKHANVNIGVP